MEVTTRRAHEVYLAARRAPELIHLLQLGSVFPSVSLPAIVEVIIRIMSGYVAGRDLCLCAWMGWGDVHATIGF